METFTHLKALIDNPNFPRQREQALKGYNPLIIDMPIMDLISDFNKLPFCFTLQSCYGHFLYQGQDDSHNLEPLPETDNIAQVDYRIAYIALVIDNCGAGNLLLGALQQIVKIDPNYIQIGCADWFWRKQVNSYALQVEPTEHMYEDSARISYEEALKVQEIRAWFFDELRKLVHHLLER